MLRSLGRSDHSFMKLQQLQLLQPVPRYLGTTTGWYGCKAREASIALIAVQKMPDTLHNTYRYRVCTKFSNDVFTVSGYSPLCKNTTTVQIFFWCWGTGLPVFIRQGIRYF
eukprot:SAG11_NODE_234_length_11857_cov_15.265776_11_plen_111_part_00